MCEFGTVKLHLLEYTAAWGFICMDSCSYQLSAVPLAAALLSTVHHAVNAAHIDDACVNIETSLLDTLMLHTFLLHTSLLCMQQCCAQACFLLLDVHLCSKLVW